MRMMEKMLAVAVVSMILPAVSEAKTAVQQDQTTGSAEAASGKRQHKPVMEVKRKSGKDKDLASGKRQHQPLVVNQPDLNSGQASGKRQHKPLVVTKGTNVGTSGKSTTDAATGNASGTPGSGSTVSTNNGTVSKTGHRPPSDRPAAGGPHRPNPARATPTPNPSSTVAPH